MATSHNYILREISDGNAIVTNIAIQNEYYELGFIAIQNAYYELGFIPQNKRHVLTFMHHWKQEGLRRWHSDPYFKSYWYWTQSVAK